MWSLTRAEEKHLRVEEPADTKDRAGIARHFVKGQKFRAAGVWEGWGRRLEVCHVTTLSAWTQDREEQKVLTLTVAVSLWGLNCQEATPVTSMQMDEVNEGKGIMGSASAKSSHLPFS